MHEGWQVGQLYLMCMMGWSLVGQPYVVMYVCPYACIFFGKNYICELCPRHPTNPLAITMAFHLAYVSQRDVVPTSQCDVVSVASSDSDSLEVVAADPPHSAWNANGRCEG